jgi:hypothetical protein
MSIYETGPSVSIYGGLPNKSVKSFLRTQLTYREAVNWIDGVMHENAANRVQAERPQYMGRAVQQRTHSDHITI